MLELGLLLSETSDFFFFLNNKELHAFYSQTLLLL